MADSQEAKLSVAEAKAQLRQKAQRASFVEYFQRHPLPILGLAAGAGLLLANKRVAKVFLKSGSVWWLGGSLLKLLFENTASLSSQGIKAEQASKDPRAIKADQTQQ